MWRVYVRRAFRKVQRAYDRRVGPYLLRRRLNAPKPIVIGASGWYDPGWTHTEQAYLDLLRPDQWERFFRRDSVPAMLAEHVWEHLTPEEARRATATCFTYIRPGGYLRLAVPDGLNPSPMYQQWVKVGGASPGQLANDHKVLYTYRTFSELLEQAGFQVRLYEYFDEAGVFHHSEWNSADGMIRRSKQWDKRNQGGELVFTSIILDAVKPAAQLLDPIALVPRIATVQPAS